MAAKKKKTSNRVNRRVTNVMLIVLLLSMIAVMAASLLNINKVRNTDSGSGEVVKTETISNEYINDYYSIGNNATDINKQYFRELNDAIDSGDTNLIAESVVKCFVTEYYTWTNKDGNYDVGGMQYIYTGRQNDFSVYSRDNFYAEMDNWLAQNERSSLIQVADVQITGTSTSNSYVVLNSDGAETSYPCVTVSASWTYEDGTVMDTAAIQSSAVFSVINHDGRMEIAGIQ